MRSTKLCLTIFALLGIAVPAIAGDNSSRPQNGAVQAELNKLSTDKPNDKGVTVTLPSKLPKMVAKPKRSRPAP